MGQDLVEIHPRELQFTCKSLPPPPCSALLICLDRRTARVDDAGGVRPRMSASIRCFVSVASVLRLADSVWRAEVNFERFPPIGVDFV